MSETVDQHDPDSGAPGRMSRRRFLGAIAAVGGTAAAGALLWEIATKDDGDDEARGKPAEPKLNAAGDREVRTLHFALGGNGAIPADAVVQIGGRQYPLSAHDDDSRAPRRWDCAVGCHP